MVVCTYVHMSDEKERNRTIVLPGSIIFSRGLQCSRAYFVPSSLFSLVAFRRSVLLCLPTRFYAVNLYFEGRTNTKLLTQSGEEFILFNVARCLVRREFRFGIFSKRTFIIVSAGCCIECSIQGPIVYHSGDFNECPGILSDFLKVKNSRKKLVVIVLWKIWLSEG